LILAASTFARPAASVYAVSMALIAVARCTGTGADLANELG
jgi:hypothetical protein